MIRRARLEKTPEVVDGFRMRGTEVSRTEAFADGVFGFGLTLLGVVSIQTPQTYDQVMADMREFIPFALCFAMFYGIWSRHYTYCRRFGLEDVKVRILTACMLFLVLAYLYPLRFIATIFARYILHVDLGKTAAEIHDARSFANLFVLYGVGFALLQLIFYMLYLHAYKVREKLALDELETLDTRWWIIEHAMLMGVPLLSIAIAHFGTPVMVPWSGWIYALMGFVGWLHGSMHGKAHRRMVEKMEAEGRLDSRDLNDQDEVVEVAVM